MNTISNNNVNFTAKMDLRKMKGNIERWKNIASEFEKKTANYPEDIFEVSNSKGAEELNIYQHEPKEDWEHCCDLTKEQAEKLLEKTDEYITKKLVKLFYIFKRQDEEFNAGNEFINKLSKNDKYKTVDSFESKFWDALVDKTIEDRKIAASEDPDLKNYQIY